MPAEAERAAQIEIWRGVAAGWGRRRAVVWEATLPVAERLVDLLDPQPGERVVEVAAGPGDTGLLAASRLQPGGALVSTDAVEEMTAIARRRAAELGVHNAEFVVGDAVELPFADGTFDGALCRFGVMLVPDCEAAARELARVLRPGGRAAVAVWASAERNPWMTSVRRAAQALGLAETTEQDAPGPFRLAAPGRLRAVLEAGGLAVAHEEDVTITWRVASLADWWEISLDTSQLLSRLARELDSAALARLREAAEALLLPFLRDGGEVAVPGVARVALGLRG